MGIRHTGSTTLVPLALSLYSLGRVSMSLNGTEATKTLSPQAAINVEFSPMRNTQFVSMAPSPSRDILPISEVRTLTKRLVPLTAIKVKPVGGFQIGSAEPLPVLLSFAIRVSVQAANN